MGPLSATLRRSLPPPVPPSQKRRYFCESAPRPRSRRPRSELHCRRAPSPVSPAGRPSQTKKNQFRGRPTENPTYLVVVQRVDGHGAAGSAVDARRSGLVVCESGAPTNGYFRRCRPSASAACVPPLKEETGGKGCAASPTKKRQRHLSPPRTSPRPADRSPNERDRPELWPPERMSRPRPSPGSSPPGRGRASPVLPRPLVLGESLQRESIQTTAPSLMRRRCFCWVQGGIPPPPPFPGTLASTSPSGAVCHGTGLRRRLLEGREGRNKGELPGRMNAMRKGIC